jgi:Tol biopolymer transport system component
VRKTLVTFIAFAFACGNGLPLLTGGDDASAPADVAVKDAVVDVHVEAGPACDVTKPFAAAVPLTGSDLSTGLEYAPALSADELTLWFSSGRDVDGGVANQVHIYSATRVTLTSSFGEPLYDTILNGDSNDSDPFLTPDGLTMYMQSDRDLDPGDLFVATRPSVTSAFSAPQPITAVNTTDDETQPTVDGQGTLWFASSRATGTGAQDIYSALAQGASFGTAAEEVELDSPDDDWSPTISSDALTIYFASKRTGGAGNDDIWVAKRTSATLPFSAPQNVAELNTAEFELPHWLSKDGCRLFMARSSGATYELYVATKPQ